MAFGDPANGGANHAGKDGTSSTSTTLPLTFATTAGNTLIIVLRRGTNVGTTTTVTISWDGGTTFPTTATLATPGLSVTSAGGLFFFYAPNITGATASNTVVKVTFDAAQTCRFSVAEYVGNFALDQANSAQGNSGTFIGPSLTTSGATVPIGGVITGLNHNTGAPASGSTGGSVTWGVRDELDHTGQPASIIYDQGGGTTAAGTFNTQGSFGSSDTWGAVTASFTNAAGGVTNFTKALAGTLSTGGSVLRAVRHSLAGAMSFAGNVLRSSGKPLAGALSFSGALGPKSLTRGLQVALTSTGGTLRAITHPFSGTLSSTGSAPRSPGHLLAGSLSFTGSSSKIPGRALGAALNFTGGIAKRAVTRILTPTLTFTGGIFRSITHPFSGSLTSSGSVLRSPARLLAGGLSFAGSTSKIPGRALAASLTFTGAITQRAVTRAIAAALTFTGAIGRVFSGGSQAFTKALTGTLTFTGSIQRGATHNLIAGLTSTGSILRTPARVILATLSFAGAMGKKSVTRIITASLPPNGSLLRVAVHSLTATLAFTGSALGKLISLRFLTGSISFAGSTARSTGRFLTPVLSFTGNTKRAMTRILLAILSPTGQTLRTAIHSLSGALSFAGVSTGAKVTLRALTGALGLTGGTRRGVGRFATATLSFVGTAAQLWHGTGKRAVRVASVVVAAVKTISQVRPRQ